MLKLKLFDYVRYWYFTLKDQARNHWEIGVITQIYRAEVHWGLGEFTVSDLSKILGTYGQILGAAAAAVSFSQPDWD